MALKTIWMRYSIIGISILSILFFAECSKSNIDYNVKAEYYYVNLSGHDITMDVFNSDKELIEQYSIKSSETLIFTLEGMGGAGPFQYNSSITEIGDSIYLSFSGIRYLTFVKDIGYNIFWEEAYDFKKVSNTQHEMKYYFTNEDFMNARDIVKE
jgi:hypothetical protein